VTAEVGGLPMRAQTHAPSRGVALLKRVASTLVLLPVFIWIVVAAPIWVFGATVVLVAALAQWEFTGMFERAGVRVFRVLGLAGGILVTASFALPISERLAFTAVLLVALTALLWPASGGPRDWQGVVVTVFGIGYVNWLLGYAFWLRDLANGEEWVLLLVWVTWLGETAAYLVGSTVGRHRLAPLVSPNKTVEGALAQLVVSVLAALIARVWFFPALSMPSALLVGLLLGVTGQVGDLVESALKRSVGTKDTGTVIPGHGGALDRIDSLLFNTPVLFYYAIHVRGPA
jgi:phosphatidate cytidylyltransferase